LGVLHWLRLFDSTGQEIKTYVLFSVVVRGQTFVVWMSCLVHKEQQWWL